MCTAITLVQGSEVNYMLAHAKLEYFGPLMEYFGPFCMDSLDVNLKTNKQTNGYDNFFI